MENKKKILIVDDDADFVEMNRIVLEKEGYKVIAAYNAQEGIDKALHCLPDLIILDVICQDPLFAATEPVAYNVVDPIFNFISLLFAFAAIVPNAVISKYSKLLANVFPCIV